MPRNIVILGSGVCGLATALRLLEREPDARVSLLETEERPGGLARSLTINGQVTDLGPHRIYTELDDVKAFLRDLAGPDMVEVQRVSRMWFHGKWMEYPPKPLQVMGVIGPFAMAGAAASFAAGKVSHALHKPEGPENFESVMVDAFGRQLYDLLVGPYAQKVWKIDPKLIHADIGRVRVSAGGLDRMIRRLLKPEKGGEQTALRQFYYVPGGVETLVRKLVGEVEKRGGVIRTQCTVNAIEPKPDGSFTVKVHYTSTNSDSEIHADSVVSTIPLPDLLAMLLRARPDERIAQLAGELRYIANFIVGIIVKRPHVSDAHWLYFPTDDTIFNRAYEPKNFHASMGRADEALLTLEITCHRDDEHWKRTDESLAHAAKEGIMATGLAAAPELGDSFVHRIPHTYPLYDLAYKERLAAIIEWLAQFPRLVSTGRQGLFLHNNMDHSIHMGFRTAAHLVEHRAAPARALYDELPRFQGFRIVD